MAVSLYGLRAKIAVAALIKGMVSKLVLLPRVAATAEALAHFIEPSAVRSGLTDGSSTYRGIVADLMKDALPDGEIGAGRDIIYDPVAGLVRASRADEPLDVESIVARAKIMPSAGNLIAAGAALRKPFVGDFAAAYQYYERAFESNPKDLRAVEGVLTTGVRSHYDWQRIWRVVSVLKPSRGRLRAGSRFWDVVDHLFTERPSVDVIFGSASLIAQHHNKIAKLHQLLIETLADRLMFLGDFRTGSTLRELMASNRVHELRGIPLESATWLRHLLGAYAYLGEIDLAERKAARPFMVTPNETSMLQVEKLQADVALLRGDALPLVHHVSARTARLPLPADEQMRQLVAGRRIAVVGPAQTDELMGSTIENYDLVVRTGYAPDVIATHAARLGVRTDISYYSGRDLKLMIAQAKPVVEIGDLKLVVARPFTHSFMPERPEWLRVSRCEFGLYFRGAPLATQRIIYDLLQFQPEEVALFNVDFFTGGQPFTEGYGQRESAFGPHSSMNDLIMIHDLLAEFRFTKAFMGTGLVTAHGVAGEVLALSDDDYLDRLETSSSLARSKAPQK